jgi:hypothetical protein
MIAENDRCVPPLPALLCSDGFSKTCHKKTNRREIIKIRAEINKIETKKPYKELMKQKVGSLKK